MNKQNNLRNMSYAVALIMLIAGGISSCKKKKKNTDEEPSSVIPAYIIFGTNGSSSYMVGAESLTEGTVTTVGNGADVTQYDGIKGSRLIEKDDYFYWVDPTGGKFSKLKFENNTLNVVKEIPFPTAGGAIGSYQWLDDHTLFINMFDSYATVNVNTMAFGSSGNYPSALLGNATAFEVDVTYISGGKIYMPFTHWDANYFSDDTSRLAVMDYPSMTNLTITKDHRASWPGGTTGAQQAMFVENGYMYVSCTNSGSTDPTTVDAAIMRIQLGTTQFDPTYFFDTNTGLTGEAQMGLYYLGNSKAIIKSGAADYSTPGDFYVVDINAQTKSKINVAKSELSYKGNVLVENGKAHILCDSDYYVYQFDPSDNSVKKGLKVQGLNGIECLYKTN